MLGTMIAMALILVLALAGYLRLRKRNREENLLNAHSIDVEKLHSILFAENPARPLRVLDIRQPLDLLAYSQTIPGAIRIAPKDIRSNPSLIASGEDTVIYCTCPTDDTAKTILNEALHLGYGKVLLLRGGLDAWKEKGYPVAPYETAFRLDTPN
jgi:rhodanese-related sulfurtransferase